MTASQPIWNGSLQDLSSIVITIRRSRASGRLTLRNAVRLGVAHLYFHHGELVHIVGTRGDARSTLEDVRGWAKATVRFERGADPGQANMNANSQYEQLLDDVIAQLQILGVVARQPEPPRMRVIESHLVSAAAPNAEQLITPFEWKLIVEGTRRVSLAVAHLVGPREAMDVLRDILDDCIAGFPSLAGLQIAPSGYVHITDRSQLDRVPRSELLEGFAALFATCQHFCAPIIGDEDARKLMLQALGDLSPALVSIGILQSSDRTLPKRQPGHDGYS